MTETGPTKIQVPYLIFFINFKIERKPQQLRNDFWGISPFGV